MNDLTPAENAKDVAIVSLTVAATKVNESLGTFSNWLVLGLGAAFSFLLANYEKIARFVYEVQIRNALVLLVFALIASVVARLLSAAVSSALGSHEASATFVKRFVESGQKLDIDVFIVQFEKGLFFYQRWLARRAMAKARAGDRVAGARLVAKLSQVHALFVLLQALLAIAAAAIVRIHPLHPARHVRDVRLQRSHVKLSL